MQSPTSSKSKYYKNIPHRQQNAKKLKNLQKVKIPRTIVDEHDMIGTTKRKSQWMSDFTPSQKQIIEGQLSKMMKTLKKKLSSPNKNIAIGVQSLGNKTQRWNEGEQIVKVQQTARKKTAIDKKQATTERKIIALQSPRPKNDTSQKQIKLCSPKKKIRVISSQASERILSPKKSIQNNMTIVSSSMENKQLKIKKKKENITQQFENESNYLLIGDSFIQIDETDTREMQSQILLFQSQDHSKQEQEFIWADFMDQKHKLETQFFEGNHSHQQTESRQNINNKTELKQCPFKFQKPADKFEFPNLNQNLQNPYSQRIPNKENIEQQNPLFQQSYQGSESSVQPYKSSYIQQDQIKARQKAINLQIKAQTQVLNRLLQSGKIERKQHEAHMDLVIEMYDKEVTQIEQLKQLMSQNEQKVASLIENTKNSLQLSAKIGTQSAQSILQIVFGNYKKLASSQNQQNKVYQTQQQLNQSFLQQLNGEIKSGPSEQPFSIQTSRDEENSLAITSSFNQQYANKLKALIQNRISSQMGFTVSNISQGFNTSVTSIYHFITHFFFFLKSFYLQEFLVYANMPYGYNVKQRLMHMQGYDDNDENGGEIIYGLEEVIRPQILDAFHKNFYSKLRSHTNCQQYEIIHNQAIFDSLNQAINKFRPYFEITGPPYPWTTCEKQLTLFLINEDCVNQMFQKVRLEVLKWSTSLCGLIVPEATQTGFISKTQTNFQEPLTIEQIFQKYTLETDCNLLQLREAKVIKQQKIDTQQTNFQWHFNDEFKTAVLFEVSGLIFEDLFCQFGNEMGIIPDRVFLQK